MKLAITGKGGVYEIIDRSIPVEQMCDRALLAAGSIKGQYHKSVAVYDDALREQNTDAARGLAPSGARSRLERFGENVWTQKQNAGVAGIVLAQLSDLPGLLSLVSMVLALATRQYAAAVLFLIYPIEAHWIWGGGWLAQMGFHDFAGSCAIHMVGGISALIGAKILGPRIGKFTKDKSGKITKVNAFPGRRQDYRSVVPCDKMRQN